jgi:hypothetical protein
MQRLDGWKVNKLVVRHDSNPLSGQQGGGACAASLLFLETYSEISQSAMFQVIMSFPLSTTP